MNQEFHRVHRLLRASSFRLFLLGAFHASGLAMLDSSNETAGKWMPEMLELAHDAALSPPGSRQAENLSTLEAQWQQERGAEAPHSGIQAGRVRGNPYHPGGAAAARFVAAFEKLTGKEVVWLNTQSKDWFSMAVACLADGPAPLLSGRTAFHERVSTRMEKLQTSFKTEALTTREGARNGDAGARKA